MAAKDLAYDMTLVTPNQAKSAIQLFIKMNTGNAQRRMQRRGLFLWGPPGVGKSDVIRQVARELNYKHIDVRLTQMEPTDLRGIPVPVTTKNDNSVEGEEVVVRWAIPQMLPRAESGSTVAKIKRNIFDRDYLDEDGNPRGDYDGAIIVLDELPNAVPSVQAGSYQLILDGSLGEYILPSNVVVIAAGNRQSDGGGTFKMPEPLKNRFTHLTFTVDFDEWQKHALSSNYNSSVIAYLSAMKSELSQFDPSKKSGDRNNNAADNAFASPRSWNAVSDLLNAVDASGNSLFDAMPESIQAAIIAGTVGSGCASKFMSFRKIAKDLPAAMDILTAKVKTISNKETNVLYAISTNLAYELKTISEKMKRDKEITAKQFKEYTDNYVRFLLDNMMPEMIVMSIRTVLSVFRISIDFKGSSAWEKLMKDYGSLILAA